MRSDNMPRPFAPLHGMEAQLLDIVTRLRYMADDGDALGVNELTVDTAHLREAADEIERLRKALREAYSHAACAIRDMMKLRGELDYCLREIKAVWDHVKKVSPWSESNDMNWSAEVGTGIFFLVQERDDFRERLEKAPYVYVDSFGCYAFGVMPEDKDKIATLIGKSGRLVVEGR